MIVFPSLLSPFKFANEPLDIVIYSAKFYWLRSINFSPSLVYLSVMVISGQYGVFVPHSHSNLNN